MHPMTLMVVVALAAAGPGVQDARSAEIAAAIEQGRAGRKLDKTCKAYGENGFAIVIEGPLGRLMRASRAARQEGRDLAPAEIGRALGGAVLTVQARRDRTLSTDSAATPMPGGPAGTWVLPEAAEAERSRERLTMGDRYRADITVRSKRSAAAASVTLTPVAPTAFINTVSSPGTRASRALPNTNMVASFDLADFHALPPGDVEVVVFMTDAGERTCKISARDRAVIR